MENPAVSVLGIFPLDKFTQEAYNRNSSLDNPDDRIGKEKEMLLIVVYNLSTDEFDPDKIEKIESAIKGQTQLIPELRVAKNEIYFSFPQDPTVTSTNVPIVISAELLSDSPKITAEIKQRFAGNIAVAFKRLPGNEHRTVTVVVKCFDPGKDGFYKTI